MIVGLAVFGEFSFTSERWIWLFSIAIIVTANSLCFWRFLPWVDCEFSYFWPQIIYSTSHQNSHMLQHYDCHGTQTGCNINLQDSHNDSMSIIFMFYIWCWKKIVVPLLGVPACIKLFCVHLIHLANVFTRERLPFARLSVHVAKFVSGGQWLWLWRLLQRHWVCRRVFLASVWSYRFN